MLPVFTISLLVSSFNFTFSRLLPLSVLHIYLIRSLLCAVPVGEGDPLYRELEAIWRHRCGLLHVVGLPLGPILFAPNQAIDITR